MASWLRRGAPLAVAPVAGRLQRHLPWFTVGLGLLLLVVGLWVGAGRALSLPRLDRCGSSRPRPLRPAFLPMAGFGAAYTVASLSCTVAPFLAVVVAGLRTGGLLDGAVLFLAYAARMGSIVGALAVATTLATPSVVGRIRRAGAWAPRAGGVLLAATGAYVAYYGWWELRVLADAQADDRVIEAAADLQRALVGLVSAVGPGGWVLVTLALAAVAVAGTTLRRRAGARPSWRSAGRTSR